MYPVDLVLAMGRGFWYPPETRVGARSPAVPLNAFLILRPAEHLFEESLTRRESKEETGILEKPN